MGFLDNLLFHRFHPGNPVDGGPVALQHADHAVDGIDDLMSDHFADEEYRAHLAKVMVKKALEA